MSNSHSLIYLTSRKSYLRRQTTNWLTKNNFPCPSDTDYGDENPGKKVSLMMADPYNKTDHLKNILEFFPANKVYYFENDPYYVNEAVNIGYLNVFSFKESYTLCKTLDKRVKLLRKPEDNAYSGIDKSVFK
ncbi:MAG: hypothetical protein ACOCUI_00240 [bacterium]